MKTSRHDKLLHKYTKGELIQFLADHDILYFWEDDRLAGELERSKMWLRYLAAHQKANEIYERKQKTVQGSSEWWALTKEYLKASVAESKWAKKL